MRQALRPVAGDDVDRLVAAYHRAEPEVEEEAFRPYRDVLAEALRRASARERIALPTGRDGVLAETLPDWPVFPDVRDALGRLRGDGWRLGILSNVDRDLIAGTRERLDVPFDLVVTAQDVRSYKPAPGHFDRFRAETAVAPGRWVHVAQSRFHDIPATARLGIPSVWIDRQGEGGDPAPAARALPGLARLPETLAELVAD
jgi:2-haloacid dehalogenase